MTAVHVLAGRSLTCTFDGLYVAWYVNYSALTGIINVIPQPLLLKSGAMAGLLEPSAQQDGSSLFKSSRGCQVPWTHAEVVHQAKLMYELLPAQVHELVASDAFKGGPIIMLDSVLESPRRKHLKQNRFWLQAVVTVFRSSVPSGYFLTDALLELNGMFKDNLLKPVNGGDKLTLALQEAAKLKKLVGHLRYLFRGTVCSKCPEVAALKALLLRNPRRDSLKTNIACLILFWGFGGA